MVMRCDESLGSTTDISSYMLAQLVRAVAGWRPSRLFSWPFKGNTVGIVVIDYSIATSLACVLTCEPNQLAVRHGRYDPLVFVSVQYPETGMTPFSPC